MQLTETRAVITGGVSGLGLAVARHLVGHGGKVALFDVNEEKGGAAVTELGADNACFYRTDVTDEAGVVANITAAKAFLGGLNVAKAAAAEMQDNPPGPDGERGVIVNTASVAAYEGQIGQAAYAASKGGVVGMTLPMAREFARFGIRVMTIAPGVFWTPMVDGMPDSVQQSLAASIPFPSRLGQPDEYASLVAFILGNPYLNGETIRLDGATRLAPK